MNEAIIETLFASLGNLTRIRIMRFLVNQKGKSYPHIGTIADALSIRHSLASRHVSVLIDAGLINAHTSAQYRFLEINTLHLDELINFLSSMKGSNETVARTDN